MSTENANTVYGRLLESVHISNYSTDRACDELEYLLEEDRWKQVGQGYDDISEFARSLNPKDEQMRFARDRRKKLAETLDKLGASQRATAKALGVSQTTVQNDLYGRPDNKLSSIPQETSTDDANSPSVDNKLSPIRLPFQVDAEDVSKATKTVTQREAKDAERQQKREANAELVKSVAPLPDTKGQAILIDPPWDWGDEGDVSQFGRGDPTYKTMSIEELMEYPVSTVADANCHLYLCITNRSLPKGFALCEAWGFRYVTCLTWCKPTIGMGNYFRGSTEHVLFGVRGSLGLLRRDVGTWFSAHRGDRHSAKPEELYQLIEQCSPGPWVELFQRTPRPGWIGHGAEV